MERKFMSLFGILFTLVTAISISGCGAASTKGGGTSSDSLPMVGQALLNTIPSGLKTHSRVGFKSGIVPSFFDVKATSTHDTIIAQFQSRFFSAGPTDILNILSGVDTAISSINTQISSSSSVPACVTQTAVSYSFTAPDGNTVQMEGQCYENNNGSLFTEWGIDSTTGTVYLTNGGPRNSDVETLITIATPITGATGKYTVSLWLSVGNNNATADGTWDGGSYTVAEIIGNTATNTFEMTAAGLGIGFAGAQIVSDGTDIYEIGSGDMGTSTTAQETLCVSAADISTTENSCTVSAANFQLIPIGREQAVGTSQTWAASQYPAGNGNVVINGTSSDATNFAPQTPANGVGAFTH